jgi:hypothetical protein
MALVTTCRAWYDNELEEQKEPSQECGCSMTTIRIDLPDALAEQAKEAGLLEPRVFEGLLREELIRRRSLGELLEMAEPVSAKNEPLSDEEVQGLVQSEIDAYRAEKRATRAGGG